MTTLHLTKHHGLGNDFLVAFHPDVDDLPALARRLCDRRRGIGADGLLVAESHEGYAARMTLYNADGSRAEMSGNGIRCFAQALASRRGDLSDQLILTDAGDRLVVLEATDDPATITARVEMGDVSTLDEPSRLVGARMSSRPAGGASQPRQSAQRGRRRRGRGGRSGRTSAARCRTSTSRSSSPVPNRTRSRCASTSVVPGSPKHAAPARAPPRMPPGRGASWPAAPTTSSCTWTVGPPP